MRPVPPPPRTVVPEPEVVLAPVPPEPEPEPSWTLVPEGEIAVIAVVNPDGLAWLGRSCELDVPLTPEQTAPPSWASVPLLGVFRSGVRPIATRGPAVCVPHANDQAQVAVPMADEGGVLVRADPRAPSLVPVTRMSAGAALPSGCASLPDPSKEKGVPVESCGSWVGRDGSRALQVHGKGESNHNLWPQSALQARILERDGERWTAGAWFPISGQGDGLPWPLAVSAGPVRRIVWQDTYAMGGSWAWVSRLDPQAGWTDGPLVYGETQPGMD